MHYLMRFGTAAVLAGGLGLLVTACATPVDDEARANDALKEARLDSVAMRGAPQPAPAVAQAGDLEKIDERIQDDIQALFSDETVWKGREFEILVHDGVVRLTGTVLSQDEKNRVTEMVARVAGVKDVINRLDVKEEDDQSGRSS